MSERPRIQYVIQRDNKGKENREKVSGTPISIAFGIVQTKKRKIFAEWDNIFFISILLEYNGKKLVRHSHWHNDDTFWIELFVKNYTKLYKMFAIGILLCGQQYLYLYDDLQFIVAVFRGE